MSSEEPNVAGTTDMCQLESKFEKLGGVAG